MTLTKPVQNGNKTLLRGLNVAGDMVQYNDFVVHDVTVKCLLNADCIDQNVFVATRKWKIVWISEVHGTAWTDLSAVTLSVVKCTWTTAITSWTALTTSTFNMRGTALTVQEWTITTVEEDQYINNWDRIAFDFTGTVTALADVVVNISLIPA